MTVTVPFGREAHCADRSPVVLQIVFVTPASREYQMSSRFASVTVRENAGAVLPQSE